MRSARPAALRRHARRPDLHLGHQLATAAFYQLIAASSDEQPPFPAADYHASEGPCIRSTPDGMTHGRRLTISGIVMMTMGEANMLKLSRHTRLLNTSTSRVADCPWKREGDLGLHAGAPRTVERMIER